ncbi:sigma 54-interacting transcriptional regulator [Desulfofundulus sp. TPOSR]|uniref:sigma 54-interacting transcriptional regulator n=1 Tax=Desulfofundulus sp. TPOSR TaxID=2714340 RepID=UPI00140CB4BD|nr:sigma 54-interacting transcriptional regulator [Desulfofundulus sp. TPOSR]NHM25771.1 sigma 54-interacting transcriptional regulator [Desulfofundulus sp. TPOSR]
MFPVKNFINHAHCPYVTEEQSLRQALCLMSKYRLPEIPVVNNEREIVATLDLFNVANYLLQFVSGDASIPQSCFQNSVNTIEKHEIIHNAAYFPVDRIVVTSSGKLGGMLTRANVISALMREIEVLRFALDQLNAGAAVFSAQGDLLYANLFFQQAMGFGDSGSVTISLKNVTSTIPASSSCEKIPVRRQYRNNGSSFILEYYPINLSTRHLGTLVILLPDYQSELANHIIEHPEQENRVREIFPDIIIVDSNMKHVLDLALKAAQTTSSVLITGETGVGKEIVAEIIHRMGPRAHKPLIKVNCAAIPETLLESELFGYERGAFTGAAKEGKIGLIEAANGGTLFLDEITELPLQLQTKLLRFLQSKEFYKLGGTKANYVDVRVIAASNRNLKHLIDEGTFRQDLYYRLCVIPINIPPLRERPKDIVPLVLHFLQQYCRLYNKEKQFSPAALLALQRYGWPGNVRELQHLVEQLVILVGSNVIDVNHLPAQMQLSQEQETKEKVKVIVNELIPLKEAYEILERELLREALRTCKSARQIAKKLGVDHTTVLRKINRQKAINVHG